MKKTKNKDKMIMIYASWLDPVTKDAMTEEIRITGTIVGLLPDYSKGNLKPAIASAPCNEYTPYTLVAYTDKDQVYTIHGDEKYITATEENTNRRNVPLRGKAQGNQTCWILFVI